MWLAAKTERIPEPARGIRELWNKQSVSHILSSQSAELLEAQGSVVAQSCLERGVVDDTRITGKLFGKSPVQTL